MLTILWLLYVSWLAGLAIQANFADERLDALTALVAAESAKNQVVGADVDDRPITFAELDPVEADARLARANRDYDAALSRINAPLHFLHLITVTAVLLFLLCVIVPPALLYGAVLTAAWIVRGFRSHSI